MRTEHMFQVCGTVQVVVAVDLYPGGAQFEFQQDISCHDLDFFWFWPVPLLKFWDSISIEPQSPPFKSYPIHYSVITSLHGPRLWQRHEIKLWKGIYVPGYFDVGPQVRSKPRTQLNNLNRLSSCKTYDNSLSASGWILHQQRAQTHPRPDSIGQSTHPSQGRHRFLVSQQRRHHPSAAHTCLWASRYVPTGFPQASPYTRHEQVVQQTETHRIPFKLPTN